jgi:hypothetical protein
MSFAANKYAVEEANLPGTPDIALSAGDDAAAKATLSSSTTTFVSASQNIAMSSTTVAHDIGAAHAGAGVSPSDKPLALLIEHNTGLPVYDSPEGILNLQASLDNIGHKSPIASLSPLSSSTHNPMSRSLSVTSPHAGGYLVSAKYALRGHNVIRIPVSCQSDTAIYFSKPGPYSDLVQATINDICEKIALTDINTVEVIIMDANLHLSSCCPLPEDLSQICTFLLSKFPKARFLLFSGDAKTQIGADSEGNAIYRTLAGTYNDIIKELPELDQKRIVYMDKGEQLVLTLRTLLNLPVPPKRGGHSSGQSKDTPKDEGRWANKRHPTLYNTKIERRLPDSGPTHSATIDMPIMVAESGAVDNVASPVAEQTTNPLAVTSPALTIEVPRPRFPWICGVGSCTSTPSPTLS